MTGADRWGTQDVSVRYGHRLALDRVSLRAEPGQVTAVVGGDGAGRTTLLGCLAGALAPTSGQVWRPGARQTGYLPAGSGIYPDLTVEENLAFRAAAHGVAPATAHERAGEFLAQAGLTGARDRLAGQLSGGMRQKLGVIAAMLHLPRLLVLDEPTTGVDPVSRAGLWRLIASAAAGGAAVVLATSYLDEAERASSVLVLSAGQPLGSGTPGEIVAAMPGTLLVAAQRPDGPAGQRAWLRLGQWRVWEPPGSASGQAEAITPDLQDAVTVATLAATLGGADAAGGPEPARGPEAAGGPEPAGGAEAAGGATEPGRAAPPSADPLPSAAAPPRSGRVPGAKTAARDGAASAPLAQCTNLTRMFGQFRAVGEVGLRLGRGEVVGLLGANGAGKTTLIRMLLGLLRPTSGEVLLFGEPPSRRTRSRIGYVPQTLGLYDDLTPAENLAFSAAVFSAARASSGAQELPASLRAFSGTVTGSLPLGIQRRAAFAQALAHQPELLILDEPTSGVDPLSRARLWETVAQAAASGAGVLVTTHYMDEAGECDRLVVMAGGRVVAEGGAADIIGDARVTVVRAADWAEAFGALDAAGLPAALSGRTLRVPGTSPQAVREALGRVQADVTQEPATLEERFFQLTLDDPVRAPAGTPGSGGAVP